MPSKVGPGMEANAVVVALPEVLMYRECPFCGATHSSQYVDELEGIVMACRDRAAPDRRGTLAAWGERDTLPVRPEIEAFSVGAP